jgi:hypothetical protein
MLKVKFMNGLKSMGNTFYSGNALEAKVLNAKSLTGKARGPFSLHLKNGRSGEFSDSITSQIKNDLFYKSFCKKSENKNLAGSGAVAQFEIFGDKAKG